MMASERPLSAPLSGQERKGPRLDLCNFAAPEHENSRYVLTSPRSLRACAGLGIKPVELLPMTLNEFAVSFRDLRLQGPALQAVYTEYEQERRGKIQAAHSERNRLLMKCHTGCLVKETVRHCQSAPRPQSASASTSGSGGEGARGGRVHCTGSGATLTDQDRRLVVALAGKYAGQRRAEEVCARVGRGRGQDARKEAEERAWQEAQRHSQLAASQRSFRDKLAQLQRARHSLTRQEEREGRSRLAAKLERWQCNVEMQATASAERARQHRQLAQDKKRAQEQLSREQEESRRGWHQELQERRASLSERARHSREEQARQRAERNRVNVATEKERFERRKREVEALEREEGEGRRASAAELASRVEERQRRMKEEKEADRKAATAAWHRQATRHETAMARLARGQEQWRGEVAQRSTAALQRAEEACRRAREEGGERMRQQREGRKQRQQDQLNRAEEERVWWARQVAAQAEAKGRRAGSALRARARAAAEGRRAALSGARTRSDLMEQHFKRSFDVMAQEAKRHANLEQISPGVPPKTSTLVIA